MHGYRLDRNDFDELKYVKDLDNGARVQLYARKSGAVWQIRANDITPAGRAGKMVRIGQANGKNGAIHQMRSWARDHPLGVNPGGNSKPVFGFGGGDDFFNLPGGI